MIKYCFFIGLILSACASFTSCRNGERHAEQTVDQLFHSGRLRGYAHVYEVNFGGDATMKDSYPVYENEDGSFTIEYDDDAYVLTKLDDPIDIFDDGSTLLRYRIDSGHYIERIPTSY